MNSADRSATPELAAIVCTRDRATLLGRALESLTAQTLPQSAFEVVVIDDGSTVETWRAVEPFLARLPLQYARQCRAGLASAKNHGLFKARAPIVLFLDDDDLADRELLERHVRAHRRHPAIADAVLGHTRLSAALEDDPLMHFVTTSGGFLFSYDAIRNGATLDYTYFWGGRSSCKRALLVAHGVFNQVFRFGCEDIELGFRLSRCGLRVHYEANALSTMIRAFTLDEFCHRLVCQGQSNAVFSRLHPDERVQQWTEVDKARAEWPSLAPAYEAVLRSARHLDDMYRRKRAAGLESVEGDLSHLHRAYWAALRASKFKGIVEGVERET